MVADFLRDVRALVADPAAWHPTHCCANAEGFTLPEFAMQHPRHGGASWHMPARFNLVCALRYVLMTWDADRRWREPAVVTRIRTYQDAAIRICHGGCVEMLEHLHEHADALAAIDRALELLAVEARVLADRQARRTEPPAGDRRWGTFR